MVTVTLLGKLGALFGRDWNLDIHTPIEAIRAINAQRDGFANYLNSTQQYEIIVDDLGAKFDLACRTIRSITICPYIGGSGAVGRIITGVALIGAALIIPGGILGISSGTVGLLGASMAVGGVVELLSEQKAANQDSFLYDASGVQRAVQGAPVPVLFGNRFISPIPISVEVENQTIEVNRVFN